MKEDDNPYTDGPRPYGLSLNHKHLPEMRLHGGLSVEPVFVPVISNVEQGLVVTIPLYTKHLSKQLKGHEIHEEI